MQDDLLLTQYDQNGSEAAFSQIVARHQTLVYGTCRRELGSEVLAEDAAQVVFLLLARNARKLRMRQSLAGWLYQTAVFVSKNARKQEARRLRKEEAAMQEVINQQAMPEPAWISIEPLLNGALSSLKPADREAVLLRFLEGHTLTETGVLLGVSEDAARMRCARAVEKMRGYLKSHGVPVSGVILVGLLADEAARPAGAAITQGTITAITTGPTPSVLLLSKGVSHTMKIAQLKIVSLAAMLLIGGSVSVSTLAHAISQKHLPPPQKHLATPKAASSSALPSMRRQAFQVGMTARGRDLQGEDIVQGVSNLSQLDDQPSVVNAETMSYSSKIAEYRAAQSQAYHQTFVVLSEMGAPADVSDWYAQASRRFSAPLMISPAVQAQAQAKYVSTPAYTATLNKYTPATEADLAADLAGMEEVKEISVQSAAQRGKVDAWLERIAPAAAWDAQVGFYATALHYQFSGAGGVYPKELIASANSLLQTAPPNTPEAVSASLRTLTSDLSKIGPVFGDGLVIIIPKSGTPSADAASQQIEQDYQSLCRAYGTSPQAATK